MDIFCDPDVDADEITGGNPLTAASNWLNPGNSTLSDFLAFPESLSTSSINMSTSSVSSFLILTPSSLTPSTLSSSSPGTLSGGKVIGGEPLREAGIDLGSQRLVLSACVGTVKPVNEWTLPLPLCDWAWHVDDEGTIGVMPNATLTECARWPWLCSLLPPPKALAMAVICPAARLEVHETGEGALEFWALDTIPAPGGKIGGGPRGVCCPKPPGLLPLLLGPLDNCGVGMSEDDAKCWGWRGWGWEWWNEGGRAYPNESFLGNVCFTKGLRCWCTKAEEFVGLLALVWPLSLTIISRPLSWLSMVDGGSRTGEGARDGPVECILSVRRGPRNGDVEGVWAMSVVHLVEEKWGGDRSEERCRKFEWGTTWNNFWEGEREFIAAESESELIGDGESSRTFVPTKWR